MKLIRTSLSALLAFALSPQLLQAGELNCDYVFQRQKAEEANELYEKIYPCSISMCGSTQWGLASGRDGGYFGHGFGMVSCACQTKDSGTGVPQLENCGPGNTLLVSTDPVYKNVNWTAVKGREFGLYGRPDSKPLNSKIKQDLLKKADQSAMFDGVELVEVGGDPKCKGEPRCVRDFALNEMIGTDFALTSARRVTCTRVPMPVRKPGDKQNALDDALAHLNNLNKESHRLAHPTDGSKPKNYNDRYEAEINNCTHPFVNALATVGLMSPRWTEDHPQSNKEAYFRAKDAADPFGAMYEAFSSGNELNVYGLRNQFRSEPDSFASKTFLGRGYIGPQAGVIMEDLPAQPQDANDPVFKIRNEEHFLSLNKEVLKSFKIKMDDQNSALQRALKTDGPETNLAKNLEQWVTKYEGALVSLRQPAMSQPKEVHEKMTAYFKEKLAETKKNLEIAKNFKPTVRVQGYDECMKRAGTETGTQNKTSR